MAGTAVHVGHRTLLGEPPGVHHHDPVGGAGHHSEVVGDQENRPVEVVTDLGEGLQNLRLHGHVQRRRGLIRDQHGGVECHGHGDHDALAHATGEFVGERVGAPGRVRDAHEVQQFDRSPPGDTPPDALVAANRLGDLLADAVQWVQAGEGVLEDHGDLGPPDLPQACRRGIGEVLAPE